jgi:hypothetical protein
VTTAPEDAPTTSASCRASARGDVGVVVTDVDDLVVDLGVEHGCEKTTAQAGLQVRAGCAAGEQRAAGGLYRHDVQIGLLLAQVAPGFGDGSAGADAGDQGVDAPVGVRPDLGARRGEVRARVARVVGLPGRPGALAELLGDLLGALDRARDARLGGHGHDDGAERGQDALALDGRAVGHDDDAGQPVDDGRLRQADAGVAARRLDDHHSRSELAAREGVVDHVHRDAVLQRAHRVARLVLDYHVAGKAGGKPAEPDQRGPSDVAGDVVEDLHVAPSAPHGPVPARLAQVHAHELEDRERLRRARVARRARGIPSRT